MSTRHCFMHMARMSFNVLYDWLFPPIDDAGEFDGDIFSILAPWTGFTNHQATFYHILANILTTDEGSTLHLA